MKLSSQATFLLFIALAFIIVGSPTTYKLTSKALGVVKLRTADASGTPTNFGLVVHSIVLAGLSYLFLKVSKHSV